MEPEKKIAGMHKELFVAFIITLVLGGWFFVTPSHRSSLFVSPSVPPDTTAGPVIVPPPIMIPKIFLTGGDEVPNGSTQHVLGNDVWISLNGLNWTQVSPNQVTTAKWSARSRHQATYFANKVWVMGGQDAAGTKNDIWSSPTGVTWTQALPIGAIWAPRYWFGLTTFQNKLWVAGGINGGSLYGDVWSSPDGRNWTQMPTPPWAARRNLGLIGWNNLLWVIGGNCAVSVSAPCNDVWTSPDGITWTNATVPTSPTGWPPTSTATIGNSLYFNIQGTAASQKIYKYIAGGWSVVNNNPSWNIPPRIFYNFIAQNNKLWMLGGTTGATNKNDVYNSTDGITWQLITAAAPWDARSEAAATVQQ